MADINEGFVKNTESTFGKPDGSREAVRNARRVVVKVPPAIQFRTLWGHQCVCDLQQPHNAEGMRAGQVLQAQGLLNNNAVFDAAPTACHDSSSCCTNLYELGLNSTQHLRPAVLNSTGFGHRRNQSPA